MAKKKNNNKSVNKNSEKKHNKKVEVTNNADSLGIGNAVKCCFAVVAVLGLTYLLTIYITDKNKKLSLAPLPTVIQYDVILAGQSFNQRNDEYLVLYLDNDKISTYSDILSTYSEKEGKVRLYKCYTNETLNKKFISNDITDKNPENAEDLRVASNTLIRFKDGKIVEYITGISEVSSYLENL